MQLFKHSVLVKLLILVLYISPVFITASSFAEGAFDEDTVLGLSPEAIDDIEKKIKPVLKGEPVTDIPEEDRLHLFTAENLFPESFNLFFRHGEYLTIVKKDYTQAIPRLKTALELKPKELDTLELLATCHTELKQEAEAVSCWETLREILDKDESNQAADLRKRVMISLYNMAKQNQMIMRQGKKFIIYTPVYAEFEQVRKELTDERLDEVYTQVTNDLSCIPAFRTSIIVLGPKTFEKVKPTSWAGGFALGGKSMTLPSERFPRSDEDASLPAKSLLLHEFTHNIIFIAGGGKCPTWLNEGLAVFSEHKNDSFTEFKPKEQVFDPIMTIDELEQEFADIRKIKETNNPRVRKAYKLAGLYARYLIQNFTMSGPRQLLNGIKDGKSFDSVLEQLTKLDVPAFNKAFRNWAMQLSN